LINTQLPTSEPTPSYRLAGSGPIDVLEYELPGAAGSLTIRQSRFIWSCTAIFASSGAVGSQEWLAAINEKARSILRDGQEISFQYVTTFGDRSLVASPPRGANETLHWKVSFKGIIHNGKLTFMCVKGRKGAAVLPGLGTALNQKWFSLH
jgi:hypothetical protein